MKLLLFTSLIFCFHSLAQAALNQVPFNSLKNLQIKGTFLAQERAILVFDINETVSGVETVSVPEAHVMTSQEKLISAEIDSAVNAVKVQVLENGDIMTVVADAAKAAFVGKISQLSSEIIGIPLYWSSQGQILTADGFGVGHVVNEGEVVAPLVDLEQKIATLTGSGSEIVITGEKKEFLASMEQLRELNAQQNENPEWAPVTDLKISNLGSVLQIEFRNSIEEESFSMFKLVSPLVVNQIKENKAKEEAIKH